MKRTGGLISPPSNSMGYTVPTKSKEIVRDISDTVFYQYYTPNAGGGYNLWSQNSNAFVRFKRWVYRQYSTIPNWKALRAAQGYLPTQPLDELQETWETPKVDVWWYHDGWREKQLTSPLVLSLPSYSNNYFSNPWYNSWATENLLSSVKLKTLSKARDMKVNLAVAFGEGRKTVAMMGETARTLGKAYRHFRKGRFAEAAKALGIAKPSGAAANNWLAYNYGWMPLVSDLVGLAELAAQHLNNLRKPRFSVRSRMDYQDEFLWNPWTSYSIQWGSLAVTWPQSRREVEVQSGLICEVVFTEKALAAQVGVGPIDLTLLAWELIPFSFVFDWLISVGTWLEAQGSLSGLTVLDGWTTKTVRVTGRPSVTPSSGWRAQGPIPVPYLCYRSHVRAKWDGTPPVLPVVANDVLKARRLGTLAALWRQRLR